MEKIFLCLSLILSSAAIGLSDDRNASQRILSRKKRYLIFPEGSSLQLVYCLTLPIIGRSTIFTIGGTAALAWELPHDPFQPFRKPAELLHRVDTPASAGGWKTQETHAPTAIKYQKVLNQPLRINSYRISNPAYATRTKPALKYSTLYHSPSYQLATKRNGVYEDAVHAYVHPIYQHVHRRTRRDLYAKIEKFFTAQSKDGRACLMKSVCEVTQAPSGKGTFMQEIIKAIFRVKPYEGHHPDEDEYDRAANVRHNCTEMYPTCQGSVWNIF